MKLPEGVVCLRKVRTVFGGEDGRTHLTWVLAYNAGIEIGSPRYEAIRTFAGGLKAPRNAGKTMEQSIMFLPVAPPAPSDTLPPDDAASPRKARPRAKNRRVQPAAKRTAKSAAKHAPKTTKPLRAKSRHLARTKRRARR